MSVARHHAEATSDLPARARALVPLLDEYAAIGDEEGHLADEVVEALHEGRFFGMWVPRSLGGSELDQVSSLEVVAQLAYGDPSTGWVLMATGLAIGTGGAYLGPEASEELFAGERFPVIAGQGTRPGAAVRVDGGFSLSGNWSFASGIKHASHIHTLAAVEGSDEVRIFVLPVEQATLIENWDVLGLRGTGSIDYTIDSVFVPESYTHLALTETPNLGGDVYRMGIIGFATICHTGWAIGIGRRLLDELIGIVQAKAGRPGALADSDSFQEKLANAEASYRAARALAFEAWGDAQATLARGEKLSRRQHTLIRLAMVHVTWAAHETCMFAYTAAGTTALRSGTLQRLFRDMHAGSQHMVASPPVLQACGRELAGIVGDDAEWRFIQLVEQP